MAEIKKLLPAGSVVRVKDAEKDMMIIGIMMKGVDSQYDYVAVPYPEGFIDTEHMYLFDHVNIDKVLFFGYVNAEFQAFRGTLAKGMELWEGQK